MSVLLLFALFILRTYASSSGCCAPPQWEAEAFQSSSIGTVHHHIYYDATTQLVRWDRVGNLESSDEIVDLQTYAIYQKGIEFLYYPTTNTCLVHYPDQFTGWCYGPSVGQTFVSSILVSGSPSTLWSGAGNKMTWVSEDGNCWPVSMQYLDTSYLFFNASLGIQNNSTVFALPSSCVFPPTSPKMTRSVDAWWNQFL